LPFSSLRLVAEELVNSSGLVTVPDFLLNAALQMVRSEIQTRAQFDIEDLVPVKRAHLAMSPGLFAVAGDDDFVLPHHTQKLFNAWGGERKLVTFAGGHNGGRPMWFLLSHCSVLARHPRPGMEQTNKGLASHPLHQSRHSAATCLRTGR